MLQDTAQAAIQRHLAQHYKSESRKGVRDNTLLIRLQKPDLNLVEFTKAPIKFTKAPANLVESIKHHNWQIRIPQDPSLIAKLIK